MQANWKKAPKRWAKPHDNAPWTGTDIKRAREMARRGLSSRQAAAQLGRSTGAVKYKAMVEGIRFHAIEQPRGAQVKAQKTRRRHDRQRARQARRA
jgi:hypothetical protein